MVKQRMTTLDVRASIDEMRSKVIGLRLINVYDLNSKMFLFRFGHGENKKSLLLENGVRFHLTEFSREKPKCPSQFTLKLRKHIRSWRLDAISQLENDRAIDLCFGVAGTESCFHIIVELFSKGNLILTNHEYTILVLLSTHKDDCVKIAVRETYQAGIQGNRNGVALHEWCVNENSGKLEMRERVVIPSSQTKEGDNHDSITEEQAKQELEQRRKLLRESWLTIYDRNAGDETFRTTLSGVHHFGPGLAEHILTLAKLPPNKKKKDNIEYSAEELFEILLPHMLTAWDIATVKLPPGGYLLKLTQKGGEGRRSKRKLQEHEQNKVSNENENEVNQEKEIHEDPILMKQIPLQNSSSGIKDSAQPLASVEPSAQSFPSGGHDDQAIGANELTTNSSPISLQSTVVAHATQYDDFSPLLLSQFESSSSVSNVVFLPSFGEVCDRFFLPTEVSKIEQHNDKKKSTAVNKLEKFERDHLRRITKLEQQQEESEKLGEALVANAEKVDEAIALINAALALGTQWSKLKALVIQRHEEGHPIAYIIHDLFFERNAISVLLEDPLCDEENQNEMPPLVVEVSLAKSAHANAADYFSKKKFSAAKLSKTIASKKKAEAGASRKGERQAAKQKVKKQLTVERKRGWWEKYNWFRTSTGDVALQGKDQQTTELLVRRIMQLGDLFVHCDVPGALPCLLRPSKIIFAGSGSGVSDSSAGSSSENSAYVHSKSLEEVGGWCISRSGSWQRKQTTSAWWIYASQITGGSAAGSYIYEGERHHIPPQPLTLGFGLLFAVERGTRTDDHNLEHLGSEHDGEKVMADPPGISGDHGMGRQTQDDSSSCRGKGGSDCTSGSCFELNNVLPDTATSLHPIITVEKLRAEQKKNFSTFSGPLSQSASGKKETGIKGGDQFSTAQSKGKNGNQYHPENSCTLVNSTSTEERKKEILQGNLTKRQSRKLQKIRRKFGDQDEEDRKLAAKLNGNPGSLVETLLSREGKVACCSQTSRKTVTVEVPSSSTDTPCKASSEIDASSNSSEENDCTTTNRSDNEEVTAMAPKSEDVQETALEEEANGAVEATKREKLNAAAGTLTARSREHVAKEMTRELATVLPLYTSSPRPGDHILHILGVCAPFSSTLGKYPFRVELVVASGKKSQVAANIIAQFTSTLEKIKNNPGNDEVNQWIAEHNDDILSHLQRLDPTEVVEQLRSDAKVR